MTSPHLMPPRWHAALTPSTRDRLWIGLVALPVALGGLFGWAAMMRVVLRDRNASPEAGDALTLLLLLLLWLAFMLWYVCPIWPRRQGRAPAGIDAEGAATGGERATVFPVDPSRWRRWLPLVLVLVLQIGLAVVNATAIRPLDDHLGGLQGPALAAVGLAFLAWLLWWLRRIPEAWPAGRRSEQCVAPLALSRSGIRVGTALAIGWDQLAGVWPDVIRRESGHRGPVLSWPAVALAWCEERHSPTPATAHRLTLRLDGHPQHPVVILAMISFYAANPSMRDELGTEHSVERSRQIMREHQIGS